MTMPFGKYQGMDLLDIPLDYLVWVEENLKSLKPELREDINFEINRRIGDSTRSGKSYQKRIVLVRVHIYSALNGTHKRI